MSAFGLNFCHGLGLGLHERPLISRLNSFIEPYELKAGMVFAVETFCPAKDGVSAARIEEEVVVTETGHEVITRFPAEKLLVCGAPYVTVDGPLEPSWSARIRLRPRPKPVRGPSTRDSSSATAANQTLGSPPCAGRAGSSRTSSRRPTPSA